MMSLPPLPKIEGDVDLVLDVFTHSSLRYGQSDGMREEYGDTDRLAELGHRILDLVVTFHYFSKRPILSATEVDRLSKEALSDDKLEAWFESYGLKYKFRLPPGEEERLSSSEIRRFFDTYVGALHIRSGGNVVQDWISRLIDPDAAHKPLLQEPTIPNVNIYPDQPIWNEASTPMPPSSPPPPLPTDSISNISMAPSNPAITLALVNQTAMQRGVMISYTAEQDGPHHMPTWNVKCLMDGVERGSGTGKSQKIAKEEAARKAYYQMGWQR